MRPRSLRLGIIAALVVPALLVVGAGVDAQSRKEGMQIIRYWKCFRCGGYLGEGVSRPTRCYHCEGKRGQSSKPRDTKAEAPYAAAGLIGLGVLVVGGLGFYGFNAYNTFKNKQGPAGKV